MSAFEWFLIFSLPAFALVCIGFHPLFIAAVVGAIELVLIYDAKHPKKQIIDIDDYAVVAA